MNKSSEVKSQRHGLGKGWKITLITLGATIAIIIALWSTAEYTHQQRVSSLKNEAEKVWQDAIKPEGGVEGTGASVRCPHWIDTVGLPDSNCPEVTRVWYVALASDSGQDFLKTIDNREGYSNGSYISYGQEEHGGGVKGKLIVDLSLSPLGNVTPPSPAPAGKTWMSLSLRVHELNK